jgi:hypothetical protein
MDAIIARASALIAFYAFVLVKADDVLQKAPTYRGEWEGASLVMLIAAVGAAFAYGMLALYGKHPKLAILLELAAVGGVFGMIAATIHDHYVAHLI